MGLSRITTRRARRLDRRLSWSLAVGAAVLAIASTVTLSDATGAVRPAAEADPALHRAQLAVAAGFRGTVCPDGWAAGQAARLSLTEAEVTARYLAQALTLTDAQLLARIEAPLAAGTAPLGPEAALAGQIALCVAESRRLIAWPLPRPAAA
jgi:hypothetical protein